MLSSFKTFSPSHFLVFIVTAFVTHTITYQYAYTHNYEACTQLGASLRSAILTHNSAPNTVSCPPCHCACSTAPVSAPAATCPVVPPLPSAEFEPCYSFKYAALPEQIIQIDLPRYDVTKNWLDRDPTIPTFDNLHKLLFGETAPNVYSSYPDGEDHSYSHTNLDEDLIESVVKANLKGDWKVMVEVGSFTGGSAVRFGRVLQRLGKPDSVMICIDTWLGDLNMWINKVGGYLNVVNGRPTVFDTFAKNVKKAGLDHKIIPVSMTSILGARLLQALKIQSDVIYLDSAHEQGETRLELALYWSLLRPGGILFGDDWGWLAVRCDAARWAADNNLQIKFQGGTWYVVK